MSYEDEKGLNGPENFSRLRSPAEKLSELLRYIDQATFTGTLSEILQIPKIAQELQQMLAPNTGDTEQSLSIQPLVLPPSLGEKIHNTIYEGIPSKDFFDFAKKYINKSKFKEDYVVIDGQSKLRRSGKTLYRLSENSLVFQVEYDFKSEKPVRYTILIQETTQK